MLKSFMLAGTALAAFSTASFAADTMPAHPRFAVQPVKHPGVNRPTALPLWNFAWTYGGTRYVAKFVGKNPTLGLTTTVPAYIIPVTLTYGSTTEDPTTGSPSVIGLTAASPIFDATTNYTQGGTNVGTTQYIDAFQRAAVWGKVKTHPTYHVLLGGPTVQPTLALTVPSNKGKIATEFGVQVILADINWFDSAIQSTVSALPANSLPIFVTTQTYLTSGGGCCIGGYHSYTGTQAYSMFTYIQKSGVFSQDVSALSHEVGEWIDDPLTTNNVACGIYEVGDPVEGGEPGHSYGDWPYVLNGFTYHLQDMVLPPYFGAPSATSVNGWSTFQGYTIGVCANGG